MAILSPLWRLKIFFLTFIFTTHAVAFLNIESLRQDLKEGWYGSTGIKGQGASGNVRFFLTSFQTQNIYKIGRFKEVILLGSYSYGEASNIKNTHRGDLHLRYAQHFSHDWQWETFTQFEFNEFQALGLRSLLGGGLRWHWLDQEKSSLFLGLGGFYEDEQIKGDVNQANFRGNLYLSFRRLINTTTEFVAVLYYQPSFKIIDDLRVRANLGLEFKLSEQVSATNEITYAQDTRPPMGILRDDLVYMVGFQWVYD